MEQVVNTLLARLEQVAARLEKIETQISSGAASGASAASEDVSASVAAFDELSTEYLTGYYTQSEAIGGPVAQQAAEFKKLIEAHRALLVVASQSKKPADADFAKLLQPQGTVAQAVSKIAGDNRPSPLFVNLSTVSEAVGAFMWVAMAPTPVPYIHEMIGASEFHSNKIRRDQKGKDEKQIDWVNHFNGFLKAFEAYVKKYHTTGLTWNPKGGDAMSAAPAAAPAPAGPAPPAAGPPPPGPPPPATATTSSSSTEADMSGVFSALNKGEGVTAGLRKVTADMKAKNRADRTGLISETPAKPTGRLGKTAPAVPKQPPKLELQGSKWVVEYQTGPVTINIEEKKQTVYVYKCEGALIQINGKLNAITIDSCKKTNIVFDEAISSCEMVNCTSVKVQINVKVPAVTIDKTSGGVIYLSKDGLDTQIFTSKSDELNVCIPGPRDRKSVV